jgi:hypothetical protein
VSASRPPRVALVERRAVRQIRLAFPFCFMT